MLHQLAYRALRYFVVDRRQRMPDVIIGGEARPYMLRWHVIPRNRVFNVYLHHFLRSDDDRALHDHPWWNLSWLLKGRYVEVVFRDPELGHEGGTRIIPRDEGALATRGAHHAHRILLYPISAVTVARAYERRVLQALEPEKLANETPIPVWTLFITGPRLRDWGFYCPKASAAGGWRHWKDFTGYRKTGTGHEVGPGCGEID